MKPGLRIGDYQELSISVQEHMQARFEDGPVHPLYGTTSLINHMEWVARQHIQPYLEPGEEGVGYQVNIRHLRPTPLGSTVRVQSIVTGLTGKRVISRVTAWHGERKIGEGMVVQALVPIEQLYEKALSLDTASPALAPEAVEQMPVITRLNFLTTNAAPTPVSQSLAASLASVLAAPETVPENETSIPIDENAIDDDEAAILNPPPAQLIAEDGRTGLSLEFLKWETGLFPCTRYDEWLIARAELQTPQENKRIEGAFLLHYEVMELIQTTERMLAGQTIPYASDFLEANIRLTLVPSEESDTYQATVRLTDPKPQDGQATSQLEVTFSLTRDALQQFTVQLKAQIVGFPSKL
jgi:fluoroacetyl-CoA thioesterase